MEQTTQGRRFQRLWGTKRLVHFLISERECACESSSLRCRLLKESFLEPGAMVRRHAARHHPRKGVGHLVSSMGPARRHIGYIGHIRVVPVTPLWLQEGRQQQPQPKADAECGQGTCGRVPPYQFFGFVIGPFHHGPFGGLRGIPLKLGISLILRRHF